jgi:hypothetical protein
MSARAAFVVNVAAYYNYCVEFVVLENNADSVVRTVVDFVDDLAQDQAVVVDQEVLVVVVVLDLADVQDVLAVDVLAVQDVLAFAAAFAEP